MHRCTPKHRFAPAGAALMLAALVLGACGPSDDTTQAERMRLLLGDAAEPAELATGDTLHVSAATRAFYEERGYEPAWTTEEAVNEEGEKLLQVIAAAVTDGLNTDPYRPDLAREITVALEEGDLDDVAKRRHTVSLDLLLTEGFNRYANDLAQGTVDPSEAGLDWRIPRERAAEEGLLARLIGGEDPAQVIQDVRPRNHQYGHLRDALASLRQVEARGGWAPLPGDLRVEAGDSGQAVALLRQRFMEGADSTEARLAAQGQARPHLFDDGLVAALEHFQARHALADDGKLGEGTIRELNHTVEERIAELKLNLDRWRWLPHDLGEKYVLVNVAGFELEVIENGRPIEQMNVVVGKSNWKTPIFADTMEHMVVNPYWNVPLSIKKDEIIPAAMRDPGYLARNNFEVVDGGGRAVSLAGVTPASLERYNVRQKPGPGNALGRFKFLFPNKDNIYLHDTPAGHLFARTRRDFSHGCIRIERPDDMAKLVMERYAQRDPDGIAAMLASGKEQWVPLKEKIPVYILYFTTWAEEDGTVRFHHDVYGRDEQLQPLAERQMAEATRPDTEAGELAAR
ncbi:MAG TPA: L,D-transpeptidase family protein [Longimicrobiales bacterium]|nr:L,D-transpeptidase family protein [Longimicrobiales bacterium]